MAFILFYVRMRLNYFRFVRLFIKAYISLV